MNTQQQIYNNLPNPSDIEALIAKLDDATVGTTSGDLLALCENAFDTLHGCLNKFYAIKNIADSLATEDTQQ